jgi:hypothetical protein
MKWLNDYSMRVVLVGILVVVIIDGGRAKADFTFGEPTKLQLAATFNMWGEITPDGLEQYFTSTRPPATESAWDIWVTTRATPEDNWREPVRLDAPINTQYTEALGCISGDGLEFYFISDRPGGSGHEDIWVTKRESMQDSWGEPENIGSVVNSSAHDDCWSISDDGLELYFWSHRSGGGDIYVARRATKDDPWQKPVNLSAVVNSSSFDGFPLILKGGLMLLFSDHQALTPRPGGYGGGDIWMTTRATRHDDWNVPVNLGPKINSTAYEGTPKISLDGSTLYFASKRPGGSGGTWGDVYQAPIIPIIDFNGDGIVDVLDMCTIVDHWGESYSLCDIGPMPWGDSVVDVEDLKVLAGHLFEDVNDSTLIAHWLLDETQGVIAYDNAAGNDGTLMGDPIWQPDGGIMAGALQLDGIDDYVTTDTVLNPGDGAFSVVAWIKGGAPGQVIFSQAGSSNWLCLDSVEGYLMTELIGPGRNSNPLWSQTVIMDNVWHRIGFVWDGSRRKLYVDSVLVAEDTQSTLPNSNNGLYIGTGKGMESGSFFSGLIDDVRIYNRAVAP